MAKPGYTAVLAEKTAEFLLQLSKRRQRHVLGHIRQLATQPFVRSDYSLEDEAGRPIEHLMVEDFVFSYWVDHAEREIRIVDIEDAS